MVHSKTKAVVVAAALVAGVALVDCGGAAFETGPTGATVDAGVDARSAPSSVDAGPVDASGDDAESAGASWCMANAPNATFCDDFDETPDVNSGWLSHVVQSGGVLGANSLVYQSAPRSVRSMIPAFTGVGGGPAPTALLGNTFLTSTIHVRLALGWRFTPIAAVAGAAAPGLIQTFYVQQNGAFVVALDYASSLSGSGFVLRMNSNAAGAASSIPLTPQPTPGSWVRAVLDIVFAKGGTGVTLTFDGLPVASMSGKPVGAEPNTQTIGYGIGAISLTGSTPAFESMSDNVVLTAL